MSNSVLKSTYCDLFCGFTKITSYCLDCPALMCSQCKVSMHKSPNTKTHIIIDFNNISLNWNDKQLISNIFEDKTLAENVYIEVNRKPIKPSRRNDTQSTADDDLPGKWECSKCTYSNLATAKKCLMCYNYRTTDNDNDYDNKIEFFQKDMLMNFVELDKIYANELELPFEHVIYCYNHGRVANLSLAKWYKSYYPNRKPLSIVNDILEENGYTIRAIDLDRQYNNLVKENNDKLIALISDPDIKAELSKCSEFLEPSDINNRNKLPRDFLNNAATEEEVWSVIIKEDSHTDHELRMLIVELYLDSKVNIETLHTFISCSELGDYLKESCSIGNVKLRHIKQAIADQVSVEGALNFLRRECGICCNEFPIPEMRGLITCQHEFCKDCILRCFQEAIACKYPCKWNCPLCDEELYKQVDKNMHYSQLRGILAEDKSTLKVFEEKLLQEQLRKSTNFHWCPNEECTNGFEAEGLNKIQCPLCHVFICVNCNRIWQQEHEDKTCPEFELWMLKNDPNLSKLFKNIGIECPGCGMRYALAAGGCLHFDCKVCGIKFCGGCYQYFVDKCDKPNCAFTNFHSHHPRNCLYFLRDRDANELEVMLKNSDYPKLQGKPEKNCPFMITTEEGLHDLPCNKNVYGTAGLCATHYKEYLVQFINRYKIDPADFADNHNLNMMLFQMVLPKLEQVKGETDAQFKGRLQKAVKEKCLFYIPKGVDEVQPAAQ